MRRTITTCLAALCVAVLATAAGWTEDQGEQGGAGDVLALGLDVAEVLGEPAGPPLIGEALEQHTEDISGVLRCTACQGLSVRDSPAETARNMKRQIRAMVAAGYDREQIEDYFVGSYGEFVLMAPSKEGFNLLVWLGPGAILLFGLGWWWVTVSRGGDAPRTPPPTRPGADPLDPWIAKVRAEVNKD